MRPYWFWRLAIYLLLLLSGPLFGVWIADKPVVAHLGFPVIPVRAEAPPFSWPALTIVGVLVAVFISPFVFRVIKSKRWHKPSKDLSVHFPKWGWLSLVLVAVSWVLAWSRFSWFESLQQHTFLPLWLGYIFVVNALTYRQTGQCMLVDRKGHLLTLGLLSSVFWWSFEYLNRFTQNWYYLEISEFGDWQYSFLATVQFSVVLPAVLSTAELLATMPRLTAGLDNFIKLSDTPRLWFGGILLACGWFSFVILALWPKLLFGFVWLAPLLTLAGLQGLAGPKGLFAEMVTGDWRRPWLLALAGLTCGVFWEMWNVKSLAHWEYSVPYVQGFQIFEMPLIGYAGYIPFGIVCGVFVEFILCGTKKDTLRLRWL